MIQIEDLGICERRYSSEMVKLRQMETGTLWDDAVDVKPCAFTYEETSIPIDQTATDEELQEIGRIMMGIPIPEEDGDES